MNNKIFYKIYLDKLRLDLCILWQNREFSVGIWKNELI